MASVLGTAHNFKFKEVAFIPEESLDEDRFMNTGAEKGGSMRTLEEEKAALDKALCEFANDCRARLHEMAERGKRGWDDSQWAKDIVMDMHIDSHKAALNGDRHHLHDIANRAMMLWWQAWRSPNKKPQS